MPDRFEEWTLPGGDIVVSIICADGARYSDQGRREERERMHKRLQHVAEIHRRIGRMKEKPNG